MKPARRSLEPIQGAARKPRRRLQWRDELLLLLLPTATILLVLAFFEALTTQRLLFSSLASSAFLIYLDPEHGTNSVRTLILSQSVAASVGWLTFLLIGSTYFSAGTAILVTIGVMLVADAMHPPAVATAMSFAFRAGEVTNLALFALALTITVTLVAMERATIWVLARKHTGKRERS